MFAESFRRHATGLALPEEPDVDAVVDAVIEFGGHRDRIGHMR